ncbi:MAG: hypothetical protein J7K54_03920 [Candidatus Aenigmarchaeota archaeon]|nr:hypothetical protein [Candidatus Aenigmarchaeota archaeon]
MFREVYNFDGCLSDGDGKSPALGNFGIYEDGTVLGGISYVGEKHIAGMPFRIEQIKGKLVSIDESSMEIETEGCIMRFEGIEKGDIEAYRNLTAGNMPKN